MTTAEKINEPEVKNWSGIVKVDKNRYAVSGLNQTTDPYTQVIKLVNRHSRSVDSVAFPLRKNDLAYRITRMKVIRNTIVAMSQKAYIHVFRVKARKLVIIVANKMIFEESTYLASLITDRKHRAVVGTEVGKLAIIKLKFSR